ncbi:9726_t:CDS:10 [Diversispora eburnea]|uniref:9726_t:CDS:1 n=1 Tax=Diversispora eburnea TaxID=1213867 RepID=A0A9N8V110_9GLOM|nr:9726_t:CDS:10 [Diversispora eburnea]
MESPISESLLSSDSFHSKLEKVIITTYETLEIWKKYENDYNGLKEVLENLDQETEYKVMVPIGNLAFMPGKLIHTNEIMAMLGENWFAERSAKQSIGIVERRIEKNQRTKIGMATDVLELNHTERLNEEGLPFVEIEDKERATISTIGGIKENPSQNTKLRKNTAIKSVVKEKETSQGGKDVDVDNMENEIWMKERRLALVSSLANLKDIRLGIEGAHWLRKLLQNTAKEPLTAAIGGLPLGLKAAIEKELELLKSFGITPVFVFNGLSVIRKDKPFSTEDNRPAKRAQAWDIYEKNRGITWGVPVSIHQPDLLCFVFEIFKEHERHSKAYVHALYGGSELLMYDVEKVITNIDLEKGTYSWLNKKHILNDLALTDEQFLDVCILAGFEYCGTFPPLNSEFVGFSFKGVHDLIKQHRNGFNAVQSYADHAAVMKTNYIETFCRTRCAIKYHMILTDEGKVEPLNSESSPSDIHDVIGYRLPDEVYYYLSRGLMSPQVINTLISGVLIESSPLCNGETQEYRQFLSHLLELRAQAMGLLTQPLHQFYHSRRVISVYWFEANTANTANTEHVLNHNVVPSVHETLNTWNVLEKCLEDEKKAQKTSTIDIAFCLKTTATEDQAAKTVMPKNNDKIIESKDEICANVLWKLLELRKFLTHSQHTHTTWGNAFCKALNITKPNNNNESHHEQLFTALELIRFGYLHGNHYSRSYYSSPSHVSDEEKKHILLISRTLSLIPAKFKGGPWIGPLSRELLAFNSFVKALNRSLRNLCEMLTLSMFLNGDCVKERPDYLDITLSLPFLYDVNTGLGIIVMTYLENVIAVTKDNENKSTNNSLINDALKKIEETFTSCINVKSDLENGFLFWDEIIVAIKSLKNAKNAEVISNEISSQFLNANIWLSSKRP